MKLKVFFRTVKSVFQYLFRSRTY